MQKKTLAKLNAEKNTLAITEKITNAENLTFGQCMKILAQTIKIKRKYI